MAGEIAIERIVKPEQHLGDISAAALTEAFGTPASAQGWSERFNQIAKETRAISELNGLSPSSDHEFLKVGQVLQIPDPRELFHK